MINNISTYIANAFSPLDFVDAACVLIICEKILKIFIFLGKKIYERCVK